ncbi:hypothetical protein PaeCFBP13512_23190 [Paenibacillus sp. CFBP13512]|nr:hypothetical protein PaeCFBP13512_23190 [Paenibacillus sp. CFBP13512]
MSERKFFYFIHNTHGINRHYHLDLIWSILLKMINFCYLLAILLKPYTLLRKPYTPLRKPYTLLRKPYTLLRKKCKYFECRLFLKF